jgi:hypothetical protein
MLRCLKAQIRNLTLAGLVGRPFVLFGSSLLSGRFRRNGRFTPRPLASNSLGALTLKSLLFSAPPRAPWKRQTVQPFKA